MHQWHHSCHPGTDSAGPGEVTAGTRIAFSHRDAGTKSTPSVDGHLHLDFSYPLSRRFLRNMWTSHDHSIVLLQLSWGGLKHVLSKAVENPAEKDQIPTTWIWATAADAAAEERSRRPDRREHRPRLALWRSIFPPAINAERPYSICGFCSARYESMRPAGTFC